MENPAGIVIDQSMSKHMTSLRVSTADQDALAEVIAVLLLGQAAHAEEILREFGSPTPVVNEVLVENALRSIALDHSTKKKLDSSRWRRDGLLFECISWIASQLEPYEGQRLSTVPHLKSTTQGIDGLLVDWDTQNNRVTLTTILEDKCSEHPRAKFRDEVLPTFKGHHAGERDTELLAAAATLIRQTGLDGIAAVTAASSVLDKSSRAYRAGLAVTQAHDSMAARAKLFKGFRDLKGVGAGSRIGVTLVVGYPKLRPWFDQLANEVSNKLNTLGEVESSV